MTQKTYFSHCRTALKFGINNKFSKTDEILVPEYICDSALHPFKQLKIKYIFYKIKPDLKIDWEQIKTKINKKTKGILFVNYFGIPNEIDKILNFAKVNNLIAIEDNAHGFMGRHQGKLLGEFGDIGISSPRKHLNIHSGGVLYSKEKIDINLDNFPLSNKKIYLDKIKFLIKKFPKIKNKLTKILQRRPLYEDQNFFREKMINDYSIDSNSLEVIKNYNYEKLKLNNMTNYYKWEKFTLDKGMKPIFGKINDDLNPWCYPAYVNNSSEQLYWFKWAWKNNIQIFSWPTLPLELVNTENESVKIWSKMLCFSTKEYNIL
tara:strand:- start:8514 stop:9470 length:957 start_codon:yes stop_codon:yes gene_type:complete